MEAEGQLDREVLALQFAAADVVAAGTVDVYGPLPSRTVTFRPRLVYKGTLPSVATVNIGPDVGPGPAATSADYAAPTGENVLFLTRDSGGYRTNACVGSHPGTPTPDEVSLFGAGTPPGPASLEDQLGALLPLVPAIAVVALGVVGLVALRRARGRRSAGLPAH